MKKYIHILLVIVTLFGCSISNQEDTKLAKEVNFDLSVINLLRSETQSEFSRLRTELITVYPEGEEKVILEPNAIEFEIEGNKSMDLVLKLKDQLKSQGYFIFRSEQNFGYSNDKVAVLKSNDQFDILKYQGTNGINYGIETDSLIQELKRWNADNKFEILGADFDWVEARFVESNMDFDSLANKMYKFCPDIVDQGTGSVEALKDELSKSNELYLWWD